VHTCNPAIRRLKQEDVEFEKKEDVEFQASLVGYTVSSRPPRLHIQRQRHR
jgi:hypothetical protein